MEFSSTSDKAGIVEDCDFLLSTDSTSYPLTQKARNVNRRLDETVSLIMQADGRWEWDDSNQTDLPIATTTLVDSQQDYNIAGATFLKIMRAEILDINGNYYLLSPISEKDIQAQALTEFQKTAGRPIYYDKLGDSIFLYPKPASTHVTLSAGLKVYFQRTPSYFISTDTTKVPGFAPLFHRILSIGAALDYAVANGMTGKINILTPMLTKLQADLVKFYSGRIRDESVRMKLGGEDYGSGSSVPRYYNSDKAVYF